MAASLASLVRSEVQGGGTFEEEMEGVVPHHEKIVWIKYALVLCMVHLHYMLGI